MTNDPYLDFWLTIALLSGGGLAVLRILRWIRTGE